MNEIPPVIASVVCENCGALSQSVQGKCWLCHEQKSVRNPYAAESESIYKGPKTREISFWDGLFTAILILCVALTILIAIGLVVQDRGMLVPFAICVGPAYLVTIARGIVTLGTKGETHPGALLRTFAVSLLVTAMVLVVMAASSIILLFLFCLQSLAK